MRRILIAEDDLAVGQALQAFLQKAGSQAETIPDGQDALERTTTSLPDLLITDMNMPGLTGWSLFSRVRTLAPRSPSS